MIKKKAALFSKPLNFPYLEKGKKKYIFVSSSTQWSNFFPVYDFFPSSMANNNIKQRKKMLKGSGKGKNNSRNVGTTKKIVYFLAKENLNDSHGKKYTRCTARFASRLCSVHITHHCN